MRLLAALLALGLAGCWQTNEVIIDPNEPCPGRWAGCEPSGTTASKTPLVHSASDVPAAERPAFDALIQASCAVLTSELFRSNLRAYQTSTPEVWLSPRLGYRDPQELAQALTGTGFRWVPTPAALIGDGDDVTARAGFAGVDGNRGLSSMTIGRRHLRRWASADVVERSCAVNTVAHETAHTLTDTDPEFFHAIEDTGNAAAPAGSTAPLASYLIGSIAQCTYLQTEGRVAADGLQTCVSVFGTNGYNSNRCDRFTAGEPVRDRPDLPAPMSPVRG